MPLKIDTGDGFLTPLVLCDECGEPIRDARDGNYQWQADGDGPGGRRFAFFTHKACCGALERGRRGLVRDGAERPAAPPRRLAPARARRDAGVGEERPHP